MSGFFALVWLVTLIAFIVYWRKKASARKAAGDNYENDPEYLSVSKTKRIIGIVCIVSFILSGATAPKSDESSKNATSNTAATTSTQSTKPNEAQKPKQEPVSFVEADIDVLINDAKSNAAKANKNYKGQNVKIIGGRVSNIESEGRYISISGSDKYSMMHVQCYPKNDQVKAAMLEVSKGQFITVYGKIKDVGEIMGYSLDLVKIE
ncbi:MAG: hypothetical protein K5982_04810 [Selenomonadaceae bacterium]|nr:hypothetical protein [Selenomonadaceae bacterium]